MGLMRNLDNLSGKFYVDQIADWDDILVGRTIVEADTGHARLTLDNGAVIEFDRSNDDCCSYVELTRLRATNNVITKVEVKDNEDETGGEGAYKAWMQVLTDSGEVIKIAEMDGNASNGYYLHGFALGVRLIRLPDE
jgi:hypothetical protein